MFEWRLILDELHTHDELEKRGLYKLQMELNVCCAFEIMNHVIIFLQHEAYVTVQQIDQRKES
jgi:hypothetical protein